MEAVDSRQAIKDMALGLLVRHGYRGMSFAEIAAALGTTRANIHYHFGTKAALIEEVLADYVAATLANLRTIWAEGEARFPARVETMLAYSRQRFDAFNGGAGPVQPWSLISRLRQDDGLLSPAGHDQLSGFTAALEQVFGAALARAALRGELRDGEMAHDLALILAAVADNAAPITLAGNGFSRLEAVYRGIVRLAAAAGAGS